MNSKSSFFKKIYTYSISEKFCIVIIISISFKWEKNLLLCSVAALTYYYDIVVAVQPSKKLFFTKHKTSEKYGRSFERCVRLCLLLKKYRRRSRTSLFTEMDDDDGHILAERRVGEKDHTSNWPNYRRFYFKKGIHFTLFIFIRKKYMFMYKFIEDMHSWVCLIFFQFSLTGTKKHTITI